VVYNKPCLRWYELSTQIILWIPMFTLETLLMILGWIVVPIGAALKLYDWRIGKDGAGNQRMEAHFTPRWLWLWSNDEDGIANDTYVKFNSEFLQILYWSCVRNPVNNLRFVPILSVEINPLKVMYFGTFGSSAGVVDMYDKDDISFWYYCWHGLYSNLRINFKLFKWRFRFWIGWKVYPQDIKGVTDYRKDSAGFAIQLKAI